MKTIIGSTLIILWSLVSINSLAQGPGPDEDLPVEKIKALKVAFITSRLNLTVDEAQAFWPVYNEYQDKILAVNKSQMDIGRTLKRKFEELSDAELNKLMDQYMALKQKETALETEYIQKFRKILPVKKVAALMKAERDFKMEIMKEYKNRHGGHDGPPPPGNGK